MNYELLLKTTKSNYMSEKFPNFNESIDIKITKEEQKLDENMSGLVDDVQKMSDGEIMREHLKGALGAASFAASVAGFTFLAYMTAKGIHLDSGVLLPMMTAATGGAPGVALLNKWNDKRKAGWVKK